jgi:hypothetical protein
MASQGKAALYQCKRGVPKRKVKSIKTESDVKRQKTIYVKDSVSVCDSSGISDKHTDDNKFTNSTQLLNDAHPHFEQSSVGSSASGGGESYVEKRASVQDDWHDLRDALQKVFVESCVPGLHCSYCKEKITGLKITCDDCGPCTLYCETCCNKIHSVVRFHIPHIWPVSVYIVIL